MLFNLDRNLKQSILNEYKKEALLYEQKKQQEKQQKIKEEQEYLEQLTKQEEENYQKLKQEEILKKNNQMKYYQEILNAPDTNSRKKEIIINNWGQNRNQSTPHQSKNNIFRKETNNNKYEIDYNSLSPIQKQKIYIRKGDDNMKNYLTDEINKDEMSKYLKEEKLYRQKYYKDLVNSQYEESQRINKDRYGTNDILIIENKRKKYFNDNIYMSNKKYDFGKSNLLHNPIVNPENNIAYNKYINFRLNKSTIFKNILDNNKNDESIIIPKDEIISNKRTIKINNNNSCDINNNNSNINDIKNKQIIQTELNNVNNNEKKINNNMNLRINNFQRFSNDNIFDYRKNKNKNNAYTIDQSLSNGTILSQAAKSNFLI